MPVTWELLEPKENQFDFSLVDGIVDRAHKDGLHLVLLWFGAFKNTFGSYALGWVRSDRKRFPMAEPLRGQPSGAFSVFSAAVLSADRSEYSSLMRHIRNHDRFHAVVMTQVENEIGLLGAFRDHSKIADERFASPVPASLSTYLRKKRDLLLLELRMPWLASGGRTEGSWRAVFGSVADEAFMAWNYGRYVESVGGFRQSRVADSVLRQRVGRGRAGNISDGRARFADDGHLAGCCSVCRLPGAGPIWRYEDVRSESREICTQQEPSRGRRE